MSEDAGWLCAMSCIMCHPQYVHTPACMSRNRRLHSCRSNSRSVCHRVIHVNRDWATHIRCRDSRTGHIGHIDKCHIMKPPGLRSGVRYEHLDTVLGSTGKHLSRFGVLVKRPQAQDVWADWDCQLDQSR